MTAYNFDEPEDLPNPSGGTLYGACELAPGMDPSLGEALATAINYIDRLSDADQENDPTRIEILAVKDILDRFANMRPDLS